MSGAVAKLAFAAEYEHRQILGLRFFTGDVEDAVQRMKTGGLLVVPAAPALTDLPTNAGYREALLNADLTITDSGFMVLLWNFLQSDHIPKNSGLSYLRAFLKQGNESGETFWIMPNAATAVRNTNWLYEQRIIGDAMSVYVAPMYGESVCDPALLAILRSRRPKHIIVTLGGGTQERLGLYLKRNLDYYPAIHCVGAALSFLSGDQVRIPVWADMFYLGWLFRCFSEPRHYLARYWGARKLLPLIVRYRENLPLNP